MTYRFLKGLRVIESSAFIAAPLAGLTLSQFGADVIRVDMIGGGIDYARMPRMPRPEGNGRSLYWTALNKGKRSIAVNLKSPEGRELIQNLATAPGPQAGVLLTNMGTPWLEHEVLAQRRADLISCTIQGNADGSTAVDYTVNCATGYPAITGGGSISNPTNHVLPAWDIACAYQAAFAISAALTRRMMTGNGAEIKLALSDVAFASLSHLGVLGEAELLNQERPSIGNDLYGAFGRDFVTADGTTIMVAAISAGQWKALVQCCDMADEISGLENRTGLDFRDEAQRFEGRAGIAGIVERWFLARSKKEAEAALNQHKVCWGRYGTARDLIANDSRVGVDNPIFERVNTAGVGEHWSAGATPRVIGLERELTSAAPLLGAHTDEILHEILNLDSPAIGRLHDDGIVAGPDRDPSQS